MNLVMKVAATVGIADRAVYERIDSPCIYTWGRSPLASPYLRPLAGRRAGFHLQFLSVPITRRARRLRVMSTWKSVVLFAPLAVATAIAACGGGSSETPPPADPSAAAGSASAAPMAETPPPAPEPAAAPTPPAAEPTPPPAPTPAAA